MIIDTTQTKIEHNICIAKVQEQLRHAPKLRDTGISEGCTCHLCPSCDYCTSNTPCKMCNTVVSNDDIIGTDQCMICLDCVGEEFDKQYPDLSTGGFCNPIVWSEDDIEVEFRCCYYNYEEEFWTWYYSKKTGYFYNAISIIQEN